MEPPDFGLPVLQTFRRARPESVTADPGSAFWQDIAPIVLRENVGGNVPAQATRVRTAWDDRAWRVLFEADDTRPWATLNTRDGALWTEEVAEVFIDPVGDLESYFEIEINPLGTVCDLMLRRTTSGWRKEFAWDAAGLGSQVRLMPGGWAAELAIPFDAVASAPPEPGGRWRVNFLRIDRPGGPGSADAEAELSAWSPTGMRNFHRVERFGTVEFVV